MGSKSLIWVGMVIGSSIGGFIPELLGASFLSLSSIIFSAVGGIIGIYCGFKFSQF